MMTPSGVRTPQTPSTGPAAGRTNSGTDLDGLGFPAVVPRPRGERILLEASLRTGVAQLPMTPFTEGTLVTVRIACRGSGTIQVYVPDVYGGTSACRPDGDHVDTSTVRGPGAESDGATPGAGGARSSAVTVVADKKQQWAVTVSERATPGPVPSPRATSTGGS